VNPSVDFSVNANLELVDKFCYLGDMLRPTGRPKKTWREIAEKDCQTRILNKEDVMDRSRWRKQTRDD